MKLWQVISHVQLVSYVLLYLLKNKALYLGKEARQTSYLFYRKEKYFGGSEVQ